VFEASADCRRFLAILLETTQRFDWRCIAYCLMTNHYHLIP
jgi:putative transposase